jgi:hypothetical protein
MDHMGVARPQDRKQWVDDLYKGFPTSGVDNQRGRNHLQPRTVRPWNRVVQNDVSLFGLAKAAEWLNHFYTDQIPHPRLFPIP